MARLEGAEQNLPRIIAVGCILHYIWESKGESLNGGWEAEAQRVAQWYEQPSRRPLASVNCQGNTVRHAFCSYSESGA